MTLTSAVFARHVVLSGGGTIHREVFGGPPQKFVRHVVLSGGMTTLQWFGEHMTNEPTEKTSVLPDENIVTVDTERFCRVATSFRPVSLAR